MKKLLLAAVLSSVCSVALAETKNTYDYVNLTYNSFDVNEADSKYTGLGLEGSKLLTENVFVTANWFSVEDADTVPGAVYDFNIDQLGVAVGYRHALNAQTDLYAQLGYVRQEMSADIAYNNQLVSDSETETGYQLKAGVKRSFGKFEGGVFLERLDAGGDADATTSIGLDGRYAFTDQFHGVVGYAKDSDVAQFKLGVSYAF
ncbi:MAG TPA: hypothetical protein DCS87_04860 [Rheinheimera sp.]|nr:hypothetical protein [Rheinheimera sp.]